MSDADGSGGFAGAVADESDFVTGGEEDGADGQRRMVRSGAETKSCTFHQYTQLQTI